MDNKEENQERNNETKPKQQKCMFRAVEGNQPKSTTTPAAKGQESQATQGESKRE